MGRMPSHLERVLHEGDDDPVQLRGKKSPSQDECSERIARTDQIDHQ